MENFPVLPVQENEQNNSQQNIELNYEREATKLLAWLQNHVQ